MVSTIYELFFQVLKVILATVSVLSSPSVQAVSIAHSAVQHRRGSFNTMLLTRQRSRHSPRLLRLIQDGDKGGQNGFPPAPKAPLALERNAREIHPSD